MRDGQIQTAIYGMYLGPLVFLLPLPCCLGSDAVFGGCIVVCCGRRSAEPPSFSGLQIQDNIISDTAADGINLHGGVTDVARLAALPSSLLPQYLLATVPRVCLEHPATATASKPRC